MVRQIPCTYWVDWSRWASVVNEFEQINRSIGYLRDQPCIWYPRFRLGNNCLLNTFNIVYSAVHGSHLGTWFTFRCYWNQLRRKLKNCWASRTPSKTAHVVFSMWNTEKNRFASRNRVFIDPDNPLYSVVFHKETTYTIWVWSIATYNWITSVLPTYSKLFCTPSYWKTGTINRLIETFLWVVSVTSYSISCGS